MSRQLEELLRRRDRLEVSKLLGPLASRLDRIGGELRTTGQVFYWDQLSKKVSNNNFFRRSSISCNLSPCFCQRVRLFGNNCAEDLTKVWDGLRFVVLSLLF